MIECPHCGSESAKAGLANGKQRWKCKSCRKHHTDRSEKKVYVGFRIQKDTLRRLMKGSKLTVSERIRMVIEQSLK